ncbi:MAG: hypothetical protein QXD60_01040 [Nanopusillaceae archaeon]
MRVDIIAGYVENEKNKNISDVLNSLITEYHSLISDLPDKNKLLSLFWDTLVIRKASYRDKKGNVRNYHYLLGVKGKKRDILKPLETSELKQAIRTVYVYRALKHFAHFLLYLYKFDIPYELKNILPDELKELGLEDVRESEYRESE